MYINLLIYNEYINLCINNPEKLGKIYKISNCDLIYKNVFQNTVPTPSESAPTSTTLAP